MTLQRRRPLRPSAGGGATTRPRRTRRSAALALAAAGLLSACGVTDDGAAARGGEEAAGRVVPPDQDPEQAPGGASDAPSDTSAPPADLVPGEPEVLVTGLDTPWGLAFLPDGSALVTERDAGRLLRVPAGGGEPALVGTVSVDDSGEGGLLGVAVGPSFAQDGFVHLYRSTSRANEVVRLPLADADGGSLDDALETVLGGIPHGRIHNGGRLAFGPDGMLYVTTGEAGTPRLSQDGESLGGKVLRLTGDGDVPADNPDPSSPVFTSGHRNVQGLAWDDAGRLFASEFGANTFDEVNRLEPGANYGWPRVEGGGGAEGLTDPLLTWAPAEAAPSGAAIAGGDLYVTALRGQRLWEVPLDGSGGVTAPRALLTEEFGRLRAVENAPDGSLWILTSNRDGRGTPGAEDDRILRLPLVAASA